MHLSIACPMTISPSPHGPCEVSVTFGSTLHSSTGMKRHLSTFKTHLKNSKPKKYKEQNSHAHQSNLCLVVHVSVLVYQKKITPIQFTNGE